MNILKKMKEYFMIYSLVFMNYILDIEPNEDSGISENEYIIKVKELLSLLDTICIGVIPACDYEDLLIR